VAIYVGGVVSDGESELVEEGGLLWVEFVGSVEEEGELLFHWVILK
jgi:hypothetical protein